MQSELDVIEQLVQRIVEIVHPLRIILFGSAARGEMGTDSDIDVLVVMPEGVHRRRTAQLLYRQIRGVGVPFDILVATPNDLEQPQGQHRSDLSDCVAGRERSVCGLKGRHQEALPIGSVMP